jgi:hypothetical protein
VGVRPKDILKHQGRVNRVFDKMNVSFSPRPIPLTASKKMQPAGNIGSEPVETSKKKRAGKVAATIESTSKSAKAADVLAQRKAEAAKTTLPPVVKKTTKLMKVNENLLRRQTEVEKVAAAEKKKTQDAAPLITLEKKIVLKRKNSSVSEKDKEIVSENPQPEMASPKLRNKKLRRFPKVMEMLMQLRHLRFNPPLFIL